MDIRHNKLLIEKQNLHSSLSLFHQNIRGLNDKGDELISLFIAYNLNPQIVCLTEHYTTEQNLFSIHLENYYLAANFSRIDTKGGGSCIFVRKYIAFHTVTVSQFSHEKILEPCAIKINLGACNILVICVYRSPSGIFNQFIYLLDLLLTSLYDARCELILCGDMNVNYLKDSNHKMELSTLLQSYNMFNVIDFPTRICNESASAIDSIFIDSTRINLFSVAAIYNGISDHEEQYLVLEETFI